MGLSGPYLLLVNIQPSWSPGFLQCIQSKVTYHQGFWNSLKRKKWWSWVLLTSLLWTVEFKTKKMQTKCFNGLWSWANNGSFLACCNWEFMTGCSTMEFAVTSMLYQGMTWGSQNNFTTLSWPMRGSENPMSNTGDLFFFEEPIWMA